MKFFWVTRFRETNPTVKSVSSSEIYKKFQASLNYFGNFTDFASFLEKFNFSRVLQVEHSPFQIGIRHKERV